MMKKVYNFQFEKMTPKEKINDVLRTNGCSSTTIERIYNCVDRLLQEQAKQIFDDILNSNDEIVKYTTKTYLVKIETMLAIKNKWVNEE